MSNQKPLIEQVQCATSDKNKHYEDKTAPIYHDEIAHLAEILGKLDEAINKTDDTITQYDKDYMDSKRYMVHN